jgi:hypothetical protein
MRCGANGRGVFRLCLELLLANGGIIPNWKLQDIPLTEWAKRFSTLFPFLIDESGEGR